MLSDGDPPRQSFSHLEVAPSLDPQNVSDQMEPEVYNAEMIDNITQTPQGFGSGNGLVGETLKKCEKCSQPTNTSLPSSSAFTQPAIMSGTATVLTSYTYPTAVSWGYPHLEVFAVSNDTSYGKTSFWKNRTLDSTGKEIWYPSDTSFTLVGGVFPDFDNIVAVTARGFEFVDIFFTGSFQTWDRIYSKSHGIVIDSDVWGDPHIWDGPYDNASTSPEVVSWDANRLDVFAVGFTPDLALYHTSFDAVSGNWASWSSLSGGPWSNFTPTAVSWAKGRLDVFMVDPNNHSLYHKYWDSDAWEPSQTSWTNLGGYCTSRPVAVSLSTGRIDIFVRGGDAGLWHLSYSSQTWSNWTSISGNVSIQGEPDAVIWATDSNRIDVFAWGSDLTLLHKSYNASINAWEPDNGLQTLGEDLNGPPKGVRDGMGSVLVFSYSRYGNLQYKSWNQTIGTWMPTDGFQNLGTP